jgi:hypothetical protein
MLLRLHIMPWFADSTLDHITPQAVRSWRTELLRRGPLGNDRGEVVSLASSDPEHGGQG